MFGHTCRSRTQLTSSAGIACNKMLAKICTDINKPNGQYRLPPDRDAIRAFVEALPIRKIPGVGKVTERLLAELGFTMAGHLVRPDRGPRPEAAHADDPCLRCIVRRPSSPTAWRCTSCSCARPLSFCCTRPWAFRPLRSMRTVHGRVMNGS